MRTFVSEQDVKDSMFSAQAVSADGDILVCVHKGYTETFEKRKDGGYDRLTSDHLTMRD